MDDSNSTDLIVGLALVQSAVSDLRSVTERGFERIDNRLEQHDKRLNRLEQRVAVHEAVTPEEGGTTSGKVVLAAMGLASAAVGALGTVAAQAMGG